MLAKPRTPARTAHLIQILALALVLCVGQFGALLHAEQHPFHQKSASCDAFFAMENGAMVPPAAPLSTVSAPPAPAATSAVEATPFFARHDPRQSRAPPVILSA